MAECPIMGLQKVREEVLAPSRPGVEVFFRPVPRFWWGWFKWFLHWLAFRESY